MFEELSASGSLSALPYRTFSLLFSSTRLGTSRPAAEADWDWIECTRGPSGRSHPAEKNGPGLLRRFGFPCKTLFLTHPFYTHSSSKSRKRSRSSYPPFLVAFLLPPLPRSPQRPARPPVHFSIHTLEAFVAV